MTAVALIHRDTIIERVSKGDRLIDISRDLGMTTHAAISKYLASDPEYQQAREAGLEARLDTREEEMEGAADSVTVARARELLSHARWRAERECPSRWGQRSHVTVARDDGLGERLRRARERVIEPESVADAPQIADAALNKPVDISHGAVDQQQSVDK